MRTASDSWDRTRGLGSPSKKICVPGFGVKDLMVMVVDFGWPRIVA